MTAPTPAMAAAQRARRRLSPEAGWLPLFLLLALAFVTGHAIDDAKWLPGSESLTDFLPWSAMLGVLAGFVTSILGWGRFRSAFAGAVVAAIAVPLLVGVVVLPHATDFYAQYRAAAEAAVDATIDLIVLGRGSTAQFGHTLLIFAFLLWGTGQFAAVAVYRYGRAMPAIVALGTYLVINVSLTRKSQLVYLVGFSLVALILLVRMHAVDERREWLRRRIGDPGPLASLTLRGGAVFVALAICGSLALTTAAHSKPLQSYWQDLGVQDTLIDIGRTLQLYVPFVTNPNGPAGVDFGPNAQIGLSWTADHSTAVRIQRDPKDPISYYWRAASYDLFDGNGWTSSDGGQEDRAPSAPITVGTTEEQTRPGWRTVSVTVVPDSFNGSQALSPGRPDNLDIASKAALDVDRGFVSSVIVPRKSSYGIVGIVPNTDPKDKSSLDAAKLQAAGEDYLADLTQDQIDRYTAVPPDAIGPKAKEVLAAVLAETPAPQTPYDIAVTMKDYLADPANFTYTQDITTVDCGDRGVVECFAEFKQGFCQYYATEMAILMRSLHIPTRFVQGFLPGARSLEGVETIENANSHAWVEVWFPGYGWYMFDPTGGGLNALAPVLPAGEAIPIPSRSPRPSTGSEVPDPSRRIGTVPGTTSSSSNGLPGPGPYIAIAMLLAVIVGGLAFVSYRRGPREVTPDSAWGSVVGVARRLGFGPRPTQTVYEFSAALADILPSARPELETVAQAKVEVAYGHRVLSPARVDAVRAATTRLRIRLLRLIVRRPRRRR